MDGKGAVSNENAGPAVLALAEQNAKNQETIDALMQKIKDQEEQIKASNAARDKAADGPQAGVATMSQASTKARYAIVIEEGRDENDASYVDVSVNGRAYRINRGEVAEVPPEIIEVLKNAVIGKASPKVDAGGEQKGVQFRNTRRFPYRVLGKAIDENGERIETFEQDQSYFE